MCLGKVCIGWEYGGKVCVGEGCVGGVHIPSLNLAPCQFAILQGLHVTVSCSFLLLFTSLMSLF